MGTETRYGYTDYAIAHRITVKLNNPLMGTETRTAMFLYTSLSHFC